MNVTEISADEVRTGDYMLVGGVFRRVTAAEYHSKNQQIMVCLAQFGYRYLEPGARVVLAA